MEKIQKALERAKKERNKVAKRQRFGKRRNNNVRSSSKFVVASLFIVLSVVAIIYGYDHFQEIDKIKLYFQSKLGFTSQDVTNPPISVKNEISKPPNADIQQENGSDHSNSTFSEKPNSSVDSVAIAERELLKDIALSKDEATKTNSHSIDSEIVSETEVVNIVSDTKTNIISDQKTQSSRIIVTEKNSKESQVNLEIQSVDKVEKESSKSALVSDIDPQKEIPKAKELKQVGATTEKADTIIKTEVQKYDNQVIRSDLTSTRPPGDKRASKSDDHQNAESITVANAKSMPPDEIINKQKKEKIRETRIFEFQADEPLETYSLAYAQKKLLSIWGVTDHTISGTDFCKRIGRNNLRCLNDKSGLTALVNYDRPAILRLDITSAPAFVLLSNANWENVTIDVLGKKHTINSNVLLNVWDGQFLMIWRPPNDIVGNILPGSEGQSVIWLRKALDKLQNLNTRGDIFDNRLIARVKQFQQEAGLVPDGIVGAKTFIILQNKLGQKPN